MHQKPSRGGGAAVPVMVGPSGAWREQRGGRGTAGLQLKNQLSLSWDWGCPESAPGPPGSGQAFAWDFFSQPEGEDWKILPCAHWQFWFFLG